MAFDKMRQQLEFIYGENAVEPLIERISQLIEAADIPKQEVNERSFVSEKDIILITYGDTLYDGKHTPLNSLHTFANQYLQDAISAIHILPFYPYSSDDGFSVIDFFAVNESLGTWDDVEALGDNFDLMFDAVFNHMSAKSDWFQAWLRQDPEYDGLFMTEHLEADLSQVTRPRATPLLTPFTRPDNDVVHVWTTFSADQVDFDVRHPNTLLRLIEVLLFYVSKGARYIRLDAIAFLWKQAGTTSIHLPQTHAIIQLMRSVLDIAAPHVILITETNVPHAENVSYFGDGKNEAQMVYNFTLPPLLFYSMLRGTSSKLAAWINSLTTPSVYTTFFNFTASHDGIGVRPVEGVLTSNELSTLIARVESTGGRVSYKRNPDGSDSPYELNVTYVDAIGGVDVPLDLRAASFLTSQTIALSLAGVPGVYIHSLLGTPNDIDGLQQTGKNRRINRAKLDAETVASEINTPSHFRHQIFHEFLRRIRIRRLQTAFHPNGDQVALDTDETGVLILQRTAPDKLQVILCVFNLTDQQQSLDLARYIKVPTTDLISGKRVSPAFELEPYQSMWLIRADD